MITRRTAIQLGLGAADARDFAHGHDVAAHSERDKNVCAYKESAGALCPTEARPHSCGFT